MTAITKASTWFVEGVPRQNVPVKKETLVSLISAIFDPQKSKTLPLSKNHTVTEDTESNSSDEQTTLIAKSKKVSRPLHKGPAAGIVYAEGNCVGIARKTLGILAQANPKRFPYAKQSNGMSTTLATYLFTGAEAILGGHDSAKQAYNIGDKQGFAENLIKTMRGGFEVLSGGSGAVTSGMAALASPQQLSSMQRVVQGITIGSSAATGLLYVGLAAPAAISLTSTISNLFSLKKEIKAGGDKQGFIYLQNKMKVLDEDRKKVLDEIFFKKEENPISAAFKRFINWIYEDEGSKLAKSNLEQLRSLITKEDLSNENMQEIFAEIDPDNTLMKSLSTEDKVFARNYIKERFKNLSRTEKINLLRLISVFYSLGLNVTKERKETTLKKQVGETVLNTLKENIGTNVEEIQASVIVDTIKAAKKSMYKSIAINIAILVACSLGMAATVIGAFFTAGILPLVSMILSVTMTGVWVGVDGYLLYQDYKNKNATFKDKAVMLLTTIALAAVSIIASALAGTTVSLAVTAAFTCGWLFYMMYVIYKWKTKERKQHAFPDSGFASRTI